ncbi:uncharacterized protein [Amphiura filiformis]|uniref:uncharacterized protein n=1 Tax=Amphiura filiformis TaxID=82378 RepID=UPI003B216C33
MEKFVFVMILLATFGSYVNTETFEFEAESYELEETFEANNIDNALVKVTRSGTSAETSVASFTTISTVCPKITSTASSSDFVLGTATVSFAANIVEAWLEITILGINDDEQEEREFFCLSITTNPGNVQNAKVYIPANDHCVNIGTSAEMNNNADNIDDPTKVHYVGPWCVGDNGYPDTISIDFLPQADGMLESMFIWLTQNSDQDTIGDYYGILLDDRDAPDDSGTALGVSRDDSIVINQDGYVGLLNDEDVDGDVITTTQHRFQLQYMESSGTISLTGDAELSLTDAGTPVDVNHILVSSGRQNFASWRICGLSPRKLPRVAARASGYIFGRPSEKAIDNTRSRLLEDSGCFISGEVTDPWLQIDLGREYDVKLVLIWPVELDDPTSNPTWLNDADVYVGSCPASSLTSNNECQTGITVTGNEDIVEVRCTGTNYGRYVYIHQNVGNQIALCEVEVYGDDVPIQDLVNVEFSSATFETTNDESDKSAIVTITRTGSSFLQCASVDLYTSRTSIINPGTTQLEDFTPIFSTNPTTIEWEANDGLSKTFTLTIADDDVCEPTETFNVYLTNPIGAILGTQSCSSVSIFDDDSVTYALPDSALSMVTVTEGKTVDISVRRSGTGTMQDGYAELEFTDITAESSDYTNTDGTVRFNATSSNTQYYTVSAVDDQAYEGDETFTVNLRSLQPSTCSFVDSQSSVTVTIVDNDSKFYWDSSDYINNIIRIPERTASTPVTIIREGLAQAKTVNIKVDDVNAEFDSDYSLSDSSVTFAANSNDRSASITINVVDDSTVEGDEVFTLTLEDPNYTDGHRNLGDPYRLTVIIVDNDAEYTLNQAQYRTSESSGILNVCVLRSGDTSTTKTVEIDSTPGTATTGEDFTPLNRITFNGNIEACGDIIIPRDNIGGKH